MKRKFLLSLLFALPVCAASVFAWENPSPSGDGWTQKASFADYRHGMFSFSIGNKGYAGTGNNNSGIIQQDFWEYDPATNTWTQKADYGGGIRYYATAFTIGNKGYAGAGITGSYQWKKDMWEYDPTTNSWAAIADFAGGYRYSMVGFGIGNKGYMGTGSYRESSSVLATYYNDFWEYDPSTNLWIRKADVPNLGRHAAVGISINDKGYIGCGYYYYDTRKNDWWQYDPLTDTWSRKADLPATPRVDANAFTIGNKGFVCGGWYYSGLSDMWEYDPSTDGWTERTYAPVTSKSKGITFNIGDKGYLGTGYNNTGGPTNDFWMYSATLEPISFVNICDQTWTQKNLSVTKYRNGDSIPFVTDATEWNSLTTGAWCYYNNDPSTEAVYGKLYNWYAVSDPRGLAPDGWHIPNNAEWIALENCAGGYSVGGGALKETGGVHWTDPNTGATNSTGFTALPGGMRNAGGNFSFLGNVGNWWSANSGQYTHYGILFRGGYYRSLFHGSTIFYGNELHESYPFPPISDFKSGMSVRCVKDVDPVIGCPFGETVYATNSTCSSVANYTVSTIAHPDPVVSYSFSGATIGSGSGTGSGQVFNCGTTTVTVTATNPAGTSTCIFTVKVLDTIPPVLTCPPTQNLCYQSNNNYTIPLLVATDNCGISEISYDVVGATTRNGSGPDASGIFFRGLSFIRWTVKDIHGNASTCITNVNLNASLLTSVSIQTSTPEDYCYNFVLNAIATPEGSYNYLWNTGETIPVKVLDNSLPDGEYTVTITDQYGCISKTASYNYQKQNLISSYTLFGLKTIHLGERNAVGFGSVGVTSPFGLATIGRNSFVVAPGGFVKAKFILVSPSATVFTKINAPAIVTLPAMQFNTSDISGLPIFNVPAFTTTILNSNYRYLKIAKGAHVTLNGTVFGDIHLAEGSEIIINSTAIDIRSLTLDNGSSSAHTTISFSSNNRVSVRVSDKVVIGEHCRVSGNNVVFYVGDQRKDIERFSVRARDTHVDANVYIPNGILSVTGNNQTGTECVMTGYFIADAIISSAREVIWNPRFCNVPSPFIVNDERAEQKNARKMDIQKPIAGTPLTILVYPNPSGQYFNLSAQSLKTEQIQINIFDAFGRQMEQLNGSSNKTYMFGHQYKPGVYMVEVQQGDGKNTFKVIKL
jgi:uncharacterized protein (TIGR02145 family)